MESKKKKKKGSVQFCCRIKILTLGHPCENPYINESWGRGPLRSQENLDANPPMDPSMKFQDSLKTFHFWTSCIPHHMHDQHQKDFGLCMAILEQLCWININHYVNAGTQIPLTSSSNNVPPGDSATVKRDKYSTSAFSRDIVPPEPQYLTPPLLQNIPEKHFITL